MSRWGEVTPGVPVGVCICVYICTSTLVKSAILTSLPAVWVERQRDRARPSSHCQLFTCCCWLAPNYVRGMWGRHSSLQAAVQSYPHSSRHVSLSVLHCPAIVLVRYFLLDCWRETLLITWTSAKWTQLHRRETRQFFWLVNLTAQSLHFYFLIFYCVGKLS